MLSVAYMFEKNSLESLVMQKSSKYSDLTFLLRLITRFLCFISIWNILEFLLSFTIFFNLECVTFFGPASARSYKIGVVGNWFVGNTVFSEMALRIFLFFCMKLGDYKGRKVTEPDFWKKFLIWRYSRKGLQISPKSDTLIFFSKTTLTVFLVFDLKLVLNMTFNLNENCFSEKFPIWVIWPRNRQKIAQNEAFGHFLDSASLAFLDFAHNDRLAWCLVVFLQFFSSVNVFLFPH